MNYTVIWLESAETELADVWWNCFDVAEARRIWFPEEGPAAVPHEREISQGSSIRPTQ